MKPDDVLLRLHEIKQYAHLCTEDCWHCWLISQVETLTAEKEKLVEALEDIREKAAHSFGSGASSFEDVAEEALASVGKGAE